MSTKTSRKHKKRPNGEGTFYQKADKTWVHQVTLGLKPNGRPDRKTFTGKTMAICIERREQYKKQKEAAEHGAQAEQTREETKSELEAQKGHSLESEISFDEAFVQWVTLYKSAKKPTTYASYLDTYRTNFQEFFGVKMLWEIDRDYVQMYYNSMQKEGARKDGKKGAYSPKTIRNHHMLLKDFFEYAREKYKLEINPALKTERPEVITPPMRVLDVDEMDIFIKEVIRETQRVAILFDLYLGLRVGELLALKVTDINPKEQKITISRNLIRVKTEAIDLSNPNIEVLNYNPDKKTHLIIQNSPKTKDSYRTLPISDELYELLIRHLYYVQQSDWPNPLNLVFPSTKGGYIEPRSFATRLEAVSERCRILKVNPHALRHTFATRMVEQKVPISTIQRLMGHADISTTQKYVSTQEQEKRSAMESMTAVWNLESFVETKTLNRTNKKLKFSDVQLPSW